MAEVTSGNNLVFEPDMRVANALNEYFDEHITEILKMPEAKFVSRNKTYIDYETWKDTVEGRFHLMLVTRYILVSPVITPAEANKIQRRLQAQGKDTRGRPREKDPSYWNATIKRKLKVYLLNKLVAQSLGVSTDAWEPPIEIKVAPYWTEPVDSFDSMLRFEEWSKVRLPRQAWIAYTATERNILAQKYPSAPREPSGGVTLDLYKVYRVDAELFEQTIYKAA